MCNLKKLHYFLRIQDYKFHVNSKMERKLPGGPKDPLSFNEFYFLKLFSHLLITSQNTNDPDFKLQRVSAFIHWVENSAFTWNGSATDRPLGPINNIYELKFTCS